MILIKNEIGNKNVNSSYLLTRILYIINELNNIDITSDNA